MLIINRIIALSLAAIFLVCGLLVAQMQAIAQPDQQWIPNTDLPGSDIASWDLRTDDPQACKTACEATPACRAWTYVRPGIQGRRARCWLKNGTPQQQSNACCISGLRAPSHLAPGAYNNRPPPPLSSDAYSRVPPPYLELSLLSPEPLLSGTPIEFGWTLTNPGHAATSGDLSVLVDNVSSEVQWKVGKAAAKSTPSGSLIRARSLVVPALPRGGQFFGTLIQMELRGGAHTVRLEYRTPTGGVVASSEMELFVIDPEPVYQSQAEQRLRYYDLARYWAPVVAQDIDPYNVRADYLAAFDYDGDWAGRNNWEHLRNFELLPVVYYWVIESQDRYFIGYAFYYPRDWTSDQKTDTVAKWDVKGIQHENDLEGVLLSILKQEPEYLKGRFEAMISEAHGHFQAYVDRNMPSSSAWFATVEPSRRFQAADMDFVADDFGFHPVVYAEAEGHGAHGQPGSDVDDYPPIFMQNKITYWQGANWGGVFRPPQSHFVQNRELTGDWGDGIIYHLEAEVDHIAKANTPEESLPRHFEVVGYSLLSIQDLWDLRTDLLAFDSYGSFTGGQAQAPWGWSGGAFFNDPAALMSQLLPNWTNGPPSPPCAYTHNSFGAPEGGCPY